jgi:hypothetical protein
VIAAANRVHRSSTLQAHLGAEEDADGRKIVWEIWNRDAPSSGGGRR